MFDQAFNYSQIPQPDLNPRAHKASSNQAQTLWIRRQSQKNTKRWVNHKSLRNYFPPVPNMKTNKRKKRLKALGSVVFPELSFYRLPLSTHFNLPHVKTIILKASYSGTRTLIPIFCRQKICSMWNRIIKIFLYRLLVTEVIPNDFLNAIFCTTFKQLLVRWVLVLEKQNYP